MSNSDSPANEPTIASAGGSHADEASTLAAFRSLRSLINIILIGLILLTGSLAILMIRDIQIARRQTREMEGRIADYQQNVEPRIVELQSKLAAFTRVHPEFAPIYTKYFGTNFSGASVGPDISEPPPRR